MDVPIVTVIIPVYNVEKYVVECLNSIIQQKLFPRIEVIIINDGSTDSSLEILSEYLIYNNITVINQSNHGLSYTRNRGLQCAKGKYIWFVDSDDYIADDSLTVLNSLFKEDYDIISFNTFLFKESSRVLQQKIMGSLKEGRFNSSKWIRKGYVYPYSGVQFYIFKRIFLINNNLKFKEGVFFEDLLFTPQAICATNKMIHLNKPLYIYRQREESITTSKMSLQKWRNMLLIADELYYVSSIKGQNKRFTINSCISSIGGVMPLSYYKTLPLKDKKIALQEYFERTYWIKSMVFSFRPYYLIRYVLMIWERIKNRFKF